MVVGPLQKDLNLYVTRFLLFASGGGLLQMLSTPERWPRCQLLAVSLGGLASRTSNGKGEVEAGWKDVKKMPAPLLLKLLSQLVHSLSVRNQPRRVKQKVNHYLLTGRSPRCSVLIFNRRFSPRIPKGLGWFWTKSIQKLSRRPAPCHYHPCFGDATFSGL